MNRGDRVQLVTDCLSRGDRKAVYPAGAKFVFRGTVSVLKEIKGSAVRNSDEVLTEALAVVSPLADRRQLRLLFPVSVLATVRKTVGHLNGRAA